MRRRSPSPAAQVIIEAGITQESLAERLNLAQPTVSMMLAGHLRPSPDLIPSIRTIGGEAAAATVARILNVEVSV